MKNGFTPMIPGFCCNWSTYLPADPARILRMRYLPNVRVVGTMGSRGVDPGLIVWAFRNGAEEVPIGGCHPGDCHYQEGNYKALRPFCSATCSPSSVEPERLEMPEGAFAGEKAIRARQTLRVQPKERGLEPPLRRHH